MVWDKDSVMGTAKTMCTSKAEWGTHSLFPLGQEHPALFSRRAGPHHVWWWLGKTMVITPNVSPFLLFHTVSCGLEYPFSQLGPVVPAVSPLSSSRMPNLLGGMGWEKALRCASPAQQQLKHSCATHTA